jgi:hypothetical protein
MNNSNITAATAAAQYNPDSFINRPPPAQQVKPISSTEMMRKALDDHKIL